MKTATCVICFITLALAGCFPPSAPMPPATTVAAPLRATPSLETHLTPPPEATPTPELLPEVRAYLDEALDILQANSVNRNQVDWPAFRTRMVNVARNVRTFSDTYDVIDIALMKLGDSHGRFLTPSKRVEMEGAVDRGSDTEGRLLDEDVGYVLLPRFATFDQEQQDLYATEVQDIIRTLDSASPCGWIADLRTNTGGSTWPMLAGIGPVLGEGQVGAFVDPDGNRTYWYYNDGQARLDDQVGAEATSPAYQLKAAGPPVAVLTGPQTRSAGESIAVAFRGRPNTRSFGQATGGFTTGVQGFPLSDGAMILLTVNTYADRTGHVYEGPILPDEPVTDANPDATLQAALDWLHVQPACANRAQPG